MRLLTCCLKTGTDAEWNKLDVVKSCATIRAWTTGADMNATMVYEEGYKARTNGVLDAEKNPYNGRKKASDWWRQGWKKADSYYKVGWLW